MTYTNSPLSLLVIEDNIGDFYLLKEHLQLSKLQVAELFHATKMLDVPAIINNKQFDIVFLDLSLPDSSGNESVITINKLLPKTPIVVFSGITEISMAQESISLGAQDYLVKGEFNKTSLAKSILYSIERKKNLQILRENSERYELIVNKATNDIIWEWDILSNKTTRGGGLVDKFGYSPEDLNSNFDWWIEKIHPDDRNKIYETLTPCLTNQINNWQLEYRALAADGNYKHIYDRGYVIFNEEQKASRMVGAMMDITEKKKLEQELLNQQIEQQKLITAVTIDAQEKQKNQISGELHDNISQLLAAVKMYMSVVIAKNKDAGELEILTQGNRYLIEAMDEIRKLSHVLAAPSLGKKNLLETLQKLIDDLNIGNLFQIQFINTANTDYTLDAKLELALYRIVQEQLNNISKYANAKLVVIELMISANELILTVTDDGVGFDIAEVRNGIGLKNIQSRVDFYSGAVNIITAPSRGCRMEIKIPFNQ